MIVIAHLHAGRPDHLAAAGARDDSLVRKLYRGVFLNLDYVTEFRYCKVNLREVGNERWSGE